MTVQILCKILLENDYATFVHNRARRGLQRKPLLQHTGLQIHTVAPSSATPRGRASYQLHCCLLALLPICTATYLHCCLLALLPVCTAAYLHHSNAQLLASTTGRYFKPLWVQRSCKILSLNSPQIYFANFKRWCKWIAPKLPIIPVWSGKKRT